jgi:hypothetical protein
MTIADPIVGSHRRLKMSAFICPPEHIGMLAAWTVIDFGAFENNDRETALYNTKYNAEVLAKENMRSITCRYGVKGLREMLGMTQKEYLRECEEWAVRYLDSPRAREVPIVWLGKMIQCYQYQACECASYRDTEAWKLTQRLSDKLLSLLPGYDTAPGWPFNNADLEMRRVRA